MILPRCIPAAENPSASFSHKIRINLSCSRYAKQLCSHCIAGSSVIWLQVGTNIRSHPAIIGPPLYQVKSLAQPMVCQLPVNPTDCSHPQGWYTVYWQTPFSSPDCLEQTQRPVLDTGPNHHSYFRSYTAGENWQWDKMAPKSNSDTRSGGVRHLLKRRNGGCWWGGLQRSAQMQMQREKDSARLQVRGVFLRGVLVIMPWQKAGTAWLSDLLSWAASKNSINSLHVNWSNCPGKGVNKHGASWHHFHSDL